MAIATTCPKCKAQFRLDEKLAGKKVRCQKCNEVFTVSAPAIPVPPPVEPAEPPPAANLPASPPAISLSLDEAPITADVVQPPPSEEVVEAELVQAPQQEEVVEAVLVEAPKPAKVVDEELAEPPPLPRSKSGKPPKDKPKASRRRASDLPKYSTVGPTLLGILGITLVGGALLACFAGAWFVLDMGKPKQARIAPVVIMKDGKKADDRFPVVKGAQDNAFKDKDAPIFDVNRDLKKDEKGFPNFDKRDDKVVPFKDKDFPFFKDKGEDKEGIKDRTFKDRPDIPALPVDFNGHGMIAAELPVNGSLSYRVPMKAGQPYNILVTADHFDPRVNVYVGGNSIAVKSATRDGKRVLLGHIATFTGEHRISVACNNGLAGPFKLQFVPADRDVAETVDFRLRPNYAVTKTIRLVDPVHNEFVGDYGPCHKYNLIVKEGEKYQFQVSNAEFVPVLRLQNGPVLVREDSGYGLERIQPTYSVPKGLSALTVYVTNKDYRLGSYTLMVNRIAELPEGPRNVAFINDRYHRDDNLTPADEKNEQGPFKSYEISMEQGQGYNIDMKSREIDAHLSLFDPDGKLVAKDDNSGGDSDARILFDPKVSGKYTLKAADAKKRIGAFALDIARTKLPESTAVNNQLNTVKRKDAGCDIVQADLGRSALGSHTFCWAPDGKSFFLLDRDGMLRRIRFPEFMEDQRLFVAKELAKIHMSAEGLLVSGIASREIWVVDPQSMQIKRRLPRTGSPVLLTSSELSFAYVTTTVTNKDGVKSQGLARYDLTKPEFVELEPFPSLQFLAITPDGRNVIGRDKDLKMVRWSIDDRKVTLAEQGTRVFRPWSSVIDPLLVSDDGKLLVHPINNKQFPKDDIQPGPASGYGIAGYRVNDFSKPAFVFDTGGLYAGATVDAKGELIAVHTRAKGLLVCDREGKLLRELAITTQGTPNVPLTRLAFHPDGRRLIGFYGILTAPKVMSIELPKDLREDKSDK